MFSRHPYISVATAVVIIAVGTIGTTGLLPPEPARVSQNVQEISDPVFDLTEVVNSYLSNESIQNLSEALQSHQVKISQFLSKSVSTPPLLCQTVNYEVNFYTGVIKAVKAAVDRLAYLEDQLQQEKTIDSHGFEVPPDLEDRLQNQSQSVQIAVDRVGYLEDRLQKMESIVSHGLEFPLDLEDNLQNQSHSVQAAEHQVGHFDQHLQGAETIPSQTQEDSLDIKDEFHTHIKEEASCCKDHCRSPFYQVGHDCLFVESYHTATWNEARKFCRAFGGDLAVPSSMQKLVNFLPVFGAARYWIGGSDLKLEGSWQWLNGSYINITHGWEEGEPNNFWKEDCLVCAGDRNWLLNDLECTKTNAFVCQDAVYAQ